MAERHQSANDGPCKRHKWADVLIAIAEGKPVQWNSDGQKWYDFNPARHNAPSLQHPFGLIEWRVKPKEPVKKYKVAYAIGDTGHSYEYVSDRYYASVEEFMASRTGDTVLWAVLLEPTMIEVES